VFKDVQESKVKLDYRDQQESKVRRVFKVILEFVELLAIT
jgi:hypothetical protein